MLQKYSLILCLLLFSLSINAQKVDHKKAIKKVIETFFDGLHNGDSAKIKRTLHKDLKMQTTSTNKEGVMILRNEKVSDFLTSIANKNPEHTYFEKLLSWDIKIDGNLASVWTPYEFYFNENFSHCGANSFQMFNNNGKWEIIYLVDMRRRDDCAALKKPK